MDGLTEGQRGLAVAGRSPALAAAASPIDVVQLPQREALPGAEGVKRPIWIWSVN